MNLNTRLASATSILVVACAAWPVLARSSGKIVDGNGAPIPPTQQHPDVGEADTSLPQTFPMVTTYNSEPWIELPPGVLWYLAHPNGSKLAAATGTDNAVIQLITGSGRFAQPTAVELGSGRLELEPLPGFVATSAKVRVRQVFSKTGIDVPPAPNVTVVTYCHVGTIASAISSGLGFEAEMGLQFVNKDSHGDWVLDPLGGKAMQLVELPFLRFEKSGAVRVNTGAEWIPLTDDQGVPLNYIARGIWNFHRRGSFAVTSGANGQNSTVRLSDLALFLITEANGHLQWGSEFPNTPKVATGGFQYVGSYQFYYGTYFKVTSGRGYLDQEQCEITVPLAWNTVENDPSIHNTGGSSTQGYHWTDPGLGH